LTHQRHAAKQLRDAVNSFSAFGLKILVVDDEENTEFLFRKKFRAAEKEKRILFFFAESVQEAMITIKNVKLDLIIADIRMPDGDGVNDVLKPIRKADNNTPVVVISAYIDDHLAYLKQENIPYFIKPISFQALTQKIYDITGKRL
jgi:DNA-binding NtrC family response regulator